jgi:hypothetical protein
VRFDVPPHLVLLAAALVCVRSAVTGRCPKPILVAEDFYYMIRTTFPLAQNCTRLAPWISGFAAVKIQHIGDPLLATPVDARGEQETIRIYRGYSLPGTSFRIRAKQDLELGTKDAACISYGSSMKQTFMARSTIRIEPDVKKAGKASAGWSPCAGRRSVANR